jgi:hypothetical protein
MRRVAPNSKEVGGFCMVYCNLKSRVISRLWRLVSRDGIWTLETGCLLVHLSFPFRFERNPQPMAGHKGACLSPQLQGKAQKGGSSSRPARAKSKNLS